MAATIPTNGIVLNSGLNVADGDVTLASGHGINFAADANATNMSVVCKTNLPPPRVSSEPPAGIGAFVTSSTLPFVSVSDVSDST